MKIFALIIPLLFTFATFAQKDSKAMLVDELQSFSCDDFLARIDNFYIQIEALPGSKGFFVINGNKDQLRKKLNVELMFESAVRQRGRDKTRSSVIRGNESGALLVKLWIVKPDSEVPDFGETKWDMNLPSGSSPFLLRSDMSQICDPHPVDGVANDLLDANTSGALFVIVHGPTAKQRSRELVQAKKMLKNFPPFRVRYLLRHSHTPYSDYYFAIGKPKRTAFKSYF